MMRTRWNTAAALEAGKSTLGEGHSVRGTVRAKAAGDQTQADGVGREARLPACCSSQAAAGVVPSPPAPPLLKGHSPEEPPPE